MIISNQVFLCGQLSHRTLTLEKSDGWLGEGGREGGDKRQQSREEGQTAPNGADFGSMIPITLGELDPILD